MGNDMFNEEQLADAAERADAAVLKESLTTDLGFDFVAYAREVMADKNHKDRDDLSCLAMEIVGALVSSIDRLQGRLDSLHRSKVEYATAERDSLRLALETATRERDEARREAKRLISLTQGWYEGRARIGAHMTFVDQRFYDSVRCERTGWPGDDADGDGGPPEE